MHTQPPPHGERLTANTCSFEQLHGEKCCVLLPRPGPTRPEASKLTPERFRSITQTWQLMLLRPDAAAAVAPAIGPMLLWMSSLLM